MRCHQRFYSSGLSVLHRGPWRAMFRDIGWASSHPPRLTSVCEHCCQRRPLWSQLQPACLDNRLCWCIIASVVNPAGWESLLWPEKGMPVGPSGPAAVALAVFGGGTGRFLPVGQTGGVEPSVCPLVVCPLLSAASLAGFRRSVFPCDSAGADRRQPSLELSLSAGARLVQTMQTSEYCR
jgi:hypothetical protein